MAAKNKTWKVVRTVNLNAPAEKVWDTVGGFFTIHTWHPDISKTKISADQVSNSTIRRQLTFPGQPLNTEELVFLDNENFLYKYRWHAGDWGEMVKGYHAEIRVVETLAGKSCMVQWTGHFVYPEDALSEFYMKGLDALAKMFN